jgi:hypothetical protein
MGSRKTLLTAFLIFITLFVGQSTVFAAAVPDTTLIWLRPEYENYHLLFMESVDLDPDAVLPAEVKVSVPKGSLIEWVGEVNRTDPSKDVETVYEVNHMTGYDEVVFTLKQNRTGQVEVRWDNGLSINGTKRKINLDWVQRYESKNVVFLFRQPEQATDVIISPLKNSASRGPDGSIYYQTDSLKLAVGQKQQLIISYNRSESAVQQDVQSQPQGMTTAKKQTDSMFTMVLGTAVVVLVLAAFIFKTKKTKQEDSYDDEEENEDAVEDVSDDLL